MTYKSLKINVVLNGIKQCCAILFPLITFPYISRVLGSDGFGKYSFSYSVVSYFLLIGALGINTYAIREGAKIRDEKKRITKFASQMFSINICSVMISYILLVIVMFLSIKIRSYAPYILLQSVSMILTAVGTDWINSIYEDFLYITLRYIFMQIIALVLMFIFVKSSNDVPAYCLISVLASSGGNLLNIFYVRKYVKYRFTLHMNIKKHIVPLMVLFANSIAITIYVNSDITMLGFYFDDITVGIYSFSSKIYNILKQLIYAIIVVSIPRIAYVVKNCREKYDVYMNKIFMALITFLLPIIAGMVGMSSTIIQVAGGKEYVTGSGVLQVLSIALFFAIVGALFTNCVLIVFNDEKECLKATIMSAIINIVLNIILLPYLGMIGAAITTVISEIVNCIMQIIFSIKFYSWRKLNFKPLRCCLIGGGLIVIVCVICNTFIDNSNFPHR